MSPSTELVRQEQSREQIELVKDTIAREQHLTDNELRLLLYTAQRLGLDPLAKQIYAVKRKGKMVIQTGIDGFRSIAARTDEYAGSDDAVFDDELKPKKASVTVYRLVGGIRCPFTASARWDQYYPGEEQGFMWRKMPHVMLGKCAEGLALRKAFPAQLSGLYTDDEMAQAGPAEVTPVEEIPDEPRGGTSPANQGAAAKPRASSAPTQPLTEKPTQLAAEPMPWDTPPQKSAGDVPEGPAAFPMPFGPEKGKPLGSLDSQVIVGAMEWAKKKGKFTEFCDAAETVLAGRDGE